MADSRQVVVVGGGAAGYFAAITCAEKNPAVRVTLCEATAHPLAKVRVSGGGRCNVTHACFAPRELVASYPRGGRELLGPFYRWQPRDTVAWFAARGVALKTEADGRMFPVTDNSQTIVDCLQHAAGIAGVMVRTQCGVARVERGGGGFQVGLNNGETLACHRLLIATGGSKASAGFAVARAMGHAIEPLVPSLFTFHVADPRLTGLAGVTVENAVATVAGTKWRGGGPLLVTHWGLSGPAVLKLSAWGAREFAAAGYKFTLQVNFAPPHTRATLGRELAAERTRHARRQLGSGCPLGLPLRLWERLVTAAGLAPDTLWANISNQALDTLAGQVTAAGFSVAGKSMNKEEFVTCGGVRLSEVDFKTMESRLCPGLHFAGEVLDIDGLTGGFNFQSAWTTGWLAGCALAGVDAERGERHRDDEK